jgi:thioredoxin reductase (NADPH)
MTDKDLIIIGGGAAGLSAAQYGARANLRTLLIEEMAPGGQALVIDSLENYPGYPDPISGFDFSESMRRQAEKFGAEIVSASVSSVRKEGEVFIVQTDSGAFTSYAAVAATGAKHRTLGVPGEKELQGRGVSYCATCDGPFFKGRKIIVAGGGDAACDEAMFLSKLASKVILVHRRERFRAQKALADRVLGNPKIEVRFNTVIEEIQGEAKLRSVVLRKTEGGAPYSEEADAVFVFIGSDPQTGMLPELAKDESGCVITDQRMETSLPGLFAAGDVRATPFRHLIVAAAEGAIAAHGAAQHVDEVMGKAYA